jgi:hypothetical protein
MSTASTLERRPSPVPSSRPLPRAAAPLAYTLAAVGAAAGAATWLVDGVLLGPAVMQGSARGTGLVMALLAVPLLVGSVVLARRPATSRAVADRALLVWVGSAAYLVYNGVLLLFGTPFNALFLLYTSALGLGLANLLAVVPALDVQRLAAGLRHGPARAVAVWIGFVATANVLLWLARIVPALGEPADAAFLEGTGLTTFPTFAQDLAFWLPLALTVAVWLWQRRPWGLVLAGALLVFWQVEAVGVAVDQWFGSSADPASDVATRGGAALFAVLAAAGCLPLVALLRRPDVADRSGRFERTSG